jgi:hypothetical protein
MSSKELAVASVESPLRSLDGRSLRESMPALSGASALESVGSPLAFLVAALSRLYANAPARPALTSANLRPLAPFLNLPAFQGFTIHW